MKKIIVIIILFFAAGSFFLLPVADVLSVSSRKNPEKVFYSAAACKEGFIISYTHSVNKGRVHDYYRTTKNNGLQLYKTQFVSYGAGIPEPEETPGAVFTVTEDGYFIENIERNVPRLLMAVGIIANHSIAVGNDVTAEHFLTDYFPPQTGIILEIKRVSLLTYITRRL